MTLAALLELLDAARTLDVAANTVIMRPTEAQRLGESAGWDAYYVEWVLRDIGVTLKLSTKVKAGEVLIVDAE